MAAREHTSYDAKPQAKPPFNMETLVAGGPDILEVPTDADLRRLMEDEKFANEIVEIRFLSDGNPNAPKGVEINVNTGGVTGAMRKDEVTGEIRPGVAGAGGKTTKMVFQRGVKYKVPRYVIEAVAHCKYQTLTQSSSPTNPYDIVQTVSDSFAYPFEVTHDPNPKGRAWLDRVLADPA